MGKKKIISDEEIKDLVLPTANDVLGIAVKLLGFNRVLVKVKMVMNAYVGFEAK